MLLEGDDVPVPTRIRHDLKMWPFFKNCIGAVDGTLIYAAVKGLD